MADLYEITFENIPKMEIRRLSREVILPKTVSAIKNGEKLPDFVKIERTILEMRNGDWVFIKLSMISFCGTTISPCSAQIIAYCGNLDLNLLFEYTDVSCGVKMPFAVALRDFAQEFASRYSITSFFGGLEPACDVETRYFTNSELGALS